MTTNSQLNLKKKPHQKTKKTSRTGTGSPEKEIPWRVISGQGKDCGESPITGNKKHKQQVQNRQGKVKNSVGNSEAKELTHMTYGCELRWGGDAGGRRVQDRWE